MAKRRQRPFLRHAHGKDVISWRPGFKKRYILVLLLIILGALFFTGPRKTTIARIEEKMDSGSTGGRFVLTGVVQAIKAGGGAPVNGQNTPTQRVFALKDATGTIFVVDGRDRGEIDTMRRPKNGERIRVVGRIVGPHDSASETAEATQDSRFVAYKVKFMK